MAFIASLLTKEQNEKFNGLDMNLGNLFSLLDTKTCSISPENFTGEKSKGVMSDSKGKEQHNVANFCKKCKITFENINDRNLMTLFYQIDYTLTEAPTDSAYFHAQFRRKHFNESSDYTIVDSVKGKGHFVGDYMAHLIRNFE